MTRLSKLLFGFLAIGLAVASPVEVVVPNVDEVSTADFLGDILNLLKVGLVTNITAEITLDTFVTNQISVDIDVKNVLLLELTIDRIVSKAGLNGTVYSSFDFTFPKPGFVVPILKTANSGRISPVTLVKGAEASLDIIPAGVLDLLDTDVYVRVATIAGKVGIPLMIGGLKQEGVPTTYNLVLS